MNPFSMDDLLIRESERIQDKFNPGRKPSRVQSHKDDSSIRRLRRREVSSDESPKPFHYEDDDGVSKFSNSFMMGIALDNGILGGALGGNIGAGMLGQAVTDSLKNL